MNAKLLVTLFVLGSLVASGCSRSEPLKDFQGDWKFVYFNSEGKIQEDKILKVLQVKVADSSFQIFAGTQLGENYTFSLNNSRTPAEIDLVYASGAHQGKRELGIYVFEENKLKLCVAGADAPRPTDFSVNVDRSLMVLERK